MMKSICRFCLYIFIVLFLFPFSAYTQASGKKFVVVIDAGHGGKDPGAIGRIIREKNINLGIALKLGALIRENHPDVKVVYTRDRDIFVELQQRANIANRVKADLFISIHTNSATNRSAYGTETYTLGLARTEENLRVAKRENSVILLEDDFSKRYEGFDPNFLGETMICILYTIPLPEDTELFSESVFVATIVRFSFRSDESVFSFALFLLMTAPCFRSQSDL